MWIEYLATNQAVGGSLLEDTSCAHHFLLQLKLIEKKPTKVGFFVSEI